MSQEKEGTVSPIRSRLTYANLMSTLAVFLVLGGGTALASYVISSNGQVGPGTISGHRPPSGDHANMIPGSINGTDLAGGSVGSGKLANGAVTHSKLSANSVTSGDVVDDSLTLSDLKGVDLSGTIALAIPANGCVKEVFGVSGAVAGQTAALTWTGAVPPDVVAGPLKVVSNQVVTYLCDLNSTSVNLSNVGVRLITFG
jgi:hypothetical protein